MNRKRTFLDECLEYGNFQLIARLKDYCLFKDLEEGLANFYKGIFNALYTDKEKLSYDKIAAKFFICRNTLDNYIKRFNDLAQKLEKVK